MTRQQGAWEPSRALMGAVGVAVIVCGAMVAGGCHPSGATRAAPEAPGVARGDASGSSTGASVERAPAADDGCLTFRDQELACDRTCQSIEPELRRCRAADASGTIDVHWRWDGTRTTTRLDLRGSALDAPAACVAQAFARFVPCTGSTSPGIGTVPLTFIAR